MPQSCSHRQYHSLRLIAALQITRLQIFDKTVAILKNMTSCVCNLHWVNALCQFVLTDCFARMELTQRMFILFVTKINDPRQADRLMSYGVTTRMRSMTINPGKGLQNARCLPLHSGMYSWSMHSSTPCLLVYMLPHTVDYLIRTDQTQTLLGQSIKQALVTFMI